jgi:aminopeptidase
MSTNGRLDRFAKLAVEIGVNLQPGQDLLVNAELEHAPLVREVARTAYAAGARYVDVRYVDPHLQRAQVELGPDEGLGWTPPWAVERMEEGMRRRAGLLSISGESAPNLMAGLDGARIARSVPAELNRTNIRGVNEGLLAWCIVPYATEAWATSLFGEPDVERLWLALERAVRLDEPDPVAAWREHAERLDARAKELNRRRLDAIRFRGPGTDLVLGLLPASRWGAAVGRTAWGQEHRPNLPTEEVFTTPDSRRAEGVVRSTRPLYFAGTAINDLTLRVVDGRVTEVHASAGEDTMRQVVAADEGGARFGEVALVDGTSRVGQLGITFRNTLLDENATCHLALGRGLDFAIEGDDRTGVNTSGTHLDFMVGGPEVDVDGLLADGTAVPLLRGDVWQL